MDQRRTSDVTQDGAAELKGMTRLTHCRMCESARLRQFLDLGQTALADRFPRKDQLGEFEPKFPLEVMMCEDCGLAQLSVVVDPEIMYCDEYPYESSTTKAGARHWQEFAETTQTMFGLGSDDLVVDAGSNVGVLLKMFQNRGMRVCGVDPADNIAQIARDNGVDTISAFFNLESAKQVVATRGRAAVLTGTNVFAHIHDLAGFVAAADHLLTPSGVIVIEMPYFGELLHNLEYDTIYHEHLSYVSLTPLVTFFDRFGMEVFEVQRRDIHGGSFRVFARRKGSSKTPVGKIVGELLEQERLEKIHDPDRLDAFAAAVAENRRQLRDLLDRLKAGGNRIAGVSAPAKGMTMLNYGGIGRDYLDFITEKSKLKIHRYTPGTQIEVLGDEALTERRPDYALLLAWNFAEEIIANLKPYVDQGGKFIIPIPVPRIVG
jgi:SAM-dependent methyltransferase